MITEQQVVVTSVLVCLVGLIAFTIGLWTGHGREREYVDQLEQELGDLMALGKRPPEVAHEPWPVHVDQALAVASHADMLDLEWEPVLMPSVVIPPDPEASVTGEIRAMTADMDRFIAGLIADTDEQLKDITR